MNGLSHGELLLEQLYGVLLDLADPAELKDPELSNGDRWGVEIFSFRERAQSLVEEVHFVIPEGGRPGTNDLNLHLNRFHEVRLFRWIVQDHFTEGTLG